jgi:uncharacterized membrane protein
MAEEKPAKRESDGSEARSGTEESAGEQGEKTELVRAAAVHHQGPLPAPDVFRQYEEIHPGTAERIVQMAEREQDARHRFRTRGQIFGLVSVVVLAGAGVAIAIFSAGTAGQVVGGIVAASGMAEVIYAFRSSRSEKSE